ncbi:MAG: ABC transporter ATP-binding protein [Desulfobacterales bacterium]|nr:ABC transporter ATP-binding protein [Desulfobacterales bacterium]
MSLLHVEDLAVEFTTRDGAVRPLTGIGFSLEQGEILGLVGETGSGKSVTAQAVMGLLPFLDGRVSKGKIRFMDQELTTLPETDYQKLRGNRISLISQNPMTSLDPVYRVGDQIVEGLRCHTGLSKPEARQRAVAVMSELGIPNAEKVFIQYPHQLSGGLKQRIVIAMGLCADARLLIADEPTTALDVTVQAQIIDLFARTVEKKNLGMIMITHDLGVIAHLCHRVAVMYAGTLVETGDVATLFAKPVHPYTRALLGCIPVMGMDEESLDAIPGNVPSVRTFPPGCRYHPRCPAVQEICRTRWPDTIDTPYGTRVACHQFTPQFTQQFSPDWRTTP